ncbi:MAG: adenylate/guanylate cyclase domain-containing protein [Kiloniellales bacterium]|nr:adenylate/guanylate cyclase domain-containing protein [Kiloniellales bacterium]
MVKKRLGLSKYSIALFLGVAIGGLVLIAVVAVLVTQLIASRSSVVVLMNESLQEAFGTIEIALESHLLPAVDQLEFLGRHIEHETYDLDDRDALQHLFVGALAATPQIEAVVLIEPDLRLLSVSQSPDRTLKVETAPKSQPAELRALLEEVEASDGVRWYELVHLDGTTYLNLRRPIRRDGAYLGFLASLVSLPGLSQFMTDIGDGHDATVFILQGDTNVLAHPSLVSPHPELSEKKPVVSIDRVGDLVLAALPSGEVRPGMEALQSEGIEVLHVEVGDRAYLVATKELDHYGSTPWQIGAWLPMEDTMDAMHRLRHGALIGLAIAVLAVLLAIVLGRLFARPIRRVAAESTKISGLDLAQVTPLPSSQISELDEQARAFNAMLSGLRSFERYVPRRLVSRLIASHANDEMASEERELTVMFTDIVGFTAMSERLPGAEVARFLNQHFSLLAGCVEAEEGTIDKYIGDALMAFWGAPDRQDDHALRACRAALAIAGAMAADNAARMAEGLPAARIRVGIHSGPVVVGNIGAPGRINYTIVGDTVNTCQRLEALCRDFDQGEAATILVSEAVAEAVGGVLAVEPVGSYSVKGRSEEVQAFRLIGG